MKTLVSVLLLGISGIFGKPAASAAPADEIVWFGIDYTLVKFIGGRDAFSDLQNIQEHYFRSWNELILTESDKYDVRGAFGVRRVAYEMDFAIEQSEQREMNAILQTDSYSVTADEVNQLAMRYTDTSDDRIGALIVMETLNKLKQESTMWLAVFNISTGEMLHLKRYSGKPGGFGFRNYWARCYYNVLKSLKSSPRKPI